MPPTHTQKLSLTDNHLQTKIKFSPEEKQTTLKCWLHAFSRQPIEEKEKTLSNVLGSSFLLMCQGFSFTKFYLYFIVLLYLIFIFFLFTLFAYILRLSVQCIYQNPELGSKWWDSLYTATCAFLWALFFVSLFCVLMLVFVLSCFILVVSLRILFVF